MWLTLETTAPTAGRSPSTAAPEPEAATGPVEVTGIFHATYPDHAHDAEALLVAEDGWLHIVTKGDTGPIALYRFPRELQPGRTMRAGARRRTARRSGQR